MKLSSPAAERNRDVIADVLASWLPADGVVLEVASGTGEHVVHFAKRLGGPTWQPSDADEDALSSIAAWQDEVGMPALLPPLRLDAASADWPIAFADALLCINMVHISSWAATIGLFAGASRLLEPSSPLILYGPFRRDGIRTADSNEAFDLSLKARDPAWGLRRVEDLEVLSPHFSLDDLVDMPANNLMLLFRRA